MVLRSLISAAVFTGIVISAIHMGGSVASFIDIPSLTLVLGCLAAGTTWSFSFDQIANAFRVALQGNANESKARQAHLVFVKMSDFSIGAGLIGTLIGLVQMLKNLDDPTVIGPAMAVALLTLLYGIILGAFVFRSMANICLSQNNLLQREERHGFISLHMAIVCLFVTLFVFFTMLLAMTG